LSDAHSSINIASALWPHESCPVRSFEKAKHHLERVPPQDNQTGKRKPQDTVTGAQPPQDRKESKPPKRFQNKLTRQARSASPRPIPMQTTNEGRGGRRAPTGRPGQAEQTVKRYPPTWAPLFHPTIRIISTSQRPIPAKNLPERTPGRFLTGGQNNKTTTSMRVMNQRFPISPPRSVYQWPRAALFHDDGFFFFFCGCNAGAVRCQRTGKWRTLSMA
jgi:hypothetical protein